MIDLDEARGRLREWAFVFRDRRAKGRTKSAEGAWRSPQIWDPPRPRATVIERHAYATNEILRAIPVEQYRALTWRFCYPWLPVAIALRALSRRLDYRVTLRDYQHLIVVGEYSVAHALEAQRLEAEEGRRQVDEMRRLIARATAARPAA